MSFLEGIVEKVGVACGMDPEDAEKLGDIASCGVNIALGNYAGAGADGLDLFGLDDEVPWLAAGLEMYGGDPLGAQVGAELGLSDLPPGREPGAVAPADGGQPGLSFAVEIAISLPIQV